MAKRFTVLPCGLKIRLTSNGVLELRGDYGAPEDDDERAKDLSLNKAHLVIQDSFSNLQAISDFFAKEAKLNKEEEGVR